MKNLKSILTAIALIQTVTINGFYLPGLAPINYLEGDKVDLQVNSIVPAVTDKNKVKVIIPYDYYHKNFYFCKPKTGIPEQEHESIGSVLLGDRIYKSGFELFMLKDEKCKLLCQASVPKSGAKFINDRIKNGYKMSWLVDGLEAAMTAVVGGKKRVVDLGFPIGSVSEAKQVQLHNHYDIEIDYHETNKKSYRVVGVSVYPSR
ncbi:Transmembrane 9 superfamily member 1 [Zancudomyces culisetae]|uniref:Transmembrane 9 superfamily member n=1 Tax=Zancudomyces culisetae TaxID=1213189 RepID=A0A1R1PVK2_ZANCU|nr:Transmembrane 9 superfamily member 1 [Zancudomyces culisetae]|eukprot:OMH84971.1 Transmembrane 9 superfamily member 1 [Zancudomyces culisetae]